MGTFRDGPVFNNKLAPLGIRTTDAGELIEHILRQDQELYNKTYREAIRSRVASAQVGDEFDVPDFN